MTTKKYELINEHKVFESFVNDKDYKFEGFEAVLKHENSYFWFVARKELILKTMQKFVPKNAKMLEVGAGTGNVSKFLQENGYESVAVGEMHLDALDFAKNYGLKERYCFNLLDTPFENEFECILAFDVLEHIERDDLALQNINKSLKDNVFDKNYVEGGGDFNPYCSSPKNTLECPRC